ncbi:MAG: histidinol-phosphatase [Acidimicrobiales bacterium]
MLDYHVHLWPHPEVADETDLVVERLAEYCDAALAAGVTEIALTEHVNRFRKGRELVEGWWSSEPNEDLRAYISHYFDHHATADLDRYVETIVAAKQAGLPIVAGLEVDYYPGLMDGVGRFLDGYPFDVLLGSVHWLGTWMFDIVNSPVQMAEWDRRGIEAAWRSYGEAIEELAGTATCDVLAHPDLVKVTGRIADAGVVEEVEERICEAAVSSGMAAELSSAGFRKPVGEAYPSASLLSRLFSRGVPITTASDTHGLSHVADRAPALRALAAAAGYSSLRGFRGRQGYDVDLGEVPSPSAAPDGAGPDVTDSKSVP